MWPKLLDLTEDECRGILRRLELESYSNVLGAFRAQGTLNAVKLRILKELRGAFHISDARHKAEVRRVVNDESLSTIAKMTYGPNTEIEWNKEGNRGFLILNRKPAQTALSAIATKATELGDMLNKQFKSPAQTNRQRTLHIDNGAITSAEKKLVTDDPTNIKSAGKVKAEKTNVIPTSTVSETKKRDSNKQQATSSSGSSFNAQQPQHSNSKAAIATNNSENGFATFVEKTKPSSELLKVMSEMATSTKLTPAAAATVPLAPRSTPIPSPITSTSRRRKSISVANHTPAKAMMISGRRDTMIETIPKIREHHPPEPLQRTDQFHKKASAVRSMTKFDLPPVTTVFTAPSSNSLHQPPAATPSLQQTKHTTKPNDKDVQIIEAFVPHNVSTIKGTQNVIKGTQNVIKGTRNVLNAISQGAQLVKVIDSKIIKQPINLSNMYVTTTAGKSTPAPVQMQPAKAHQPTETIRLPQSTYKAHKIQVIAANASQLPLTSTVSSTSHNNVIQNSIPTVRPRPRMITIHPNSTILNVPTQHMTTITNEAPSSEYVYEEPINDWQNYDPNFYSNNPLHVEQANGGGYVKIINRTQNDNTSHNDYDYQNNDDIIYDDGGGEGEDDIIDGEIVDDIITYDGATDDYSMDNVIEMDTDGGTIYTTNDNVVTFISNNMIGS